MKRPYIAYKPENAKEKKGKEKRKVRILAISDTHCNHQLIDIKSWPEADIFIHAGDFTLKSGGHEFKNFREFLCRLPYKHKIVVAGNHDFGLEPSDDVCDDISHCWQVPKAERVNSPKEIEKLKAVCTYLCHDFVEVEGVKIFATPHVWIGYQMAFTAPFITKEEVWQKLPEKVDVLVTHIPPFGIRDETHEKVHVGCPILLGMV
jgi:predicted phosphodiesterase